MRAAGGHRRRRGERRPGPRRQAPTPSASATTSPTTAVESVCRALVDAVREGRLPLDRLAEAAGRVEALAGWASRAATPVDVERPRSGLDAARRALVVDGDPRLDGPARVVELSPEPNIAAGPAEHSLATAARGERGRRRAARHRRPGRAPPRLGAAGGRAAPRRAARTRSSSRRACRCGARPGARLRRDERRRPGEPRRSGRAARRG